MSPVTTVGQVVVTGAKPVPAMDRVCRVATVSGGEKRTTKMVIFTEPPVTALKINGFVVTPGVGSTQFEFRSTSTGST